MERKKLAVITARADDRVQKDIICGISQAAFSSDTDVVVFSNIYNHWKEDESLTFENIVYDFFEPDGFDGVIITAEAFMSLSVISDAIEKIKKSKVPAVVIGGEIKGFKSLYCDDIKDMEDICDHIISKHNLTDIDILTGPEDSIFSHRRLQGCQNSFAKHSIPFDKSKIYYGDFWYDSGYNLAMRYINKEIPMPQAVVCANDCMAYQLCDVLSSAGIKIPEDITVTGYDCTGGRIYHHPVLTTYLGSRREIGIQAVNCLLSTDFPVPETNRFMSGNTCSCGTNPSELNAEITAEHIEHPGTFVSDYVQFSTAQFSQELTLCRSVRDFFKVINNYFFFHEANNLFFCLNNSRNDAVKQSDSFLCSNMDGSENPDEPITVSKKSLIKFITQARNKPSVYYFCPMCFQKQLYGYIALAYEHPERFRYQIRSWQRIVSNSLEFLRLKNDIHYLTLCQRTSALHDALTGFLKLSEFSRTCDEKSSRNSSLICVKISLSAYEEYVCDLNRRNDIISACAAAIKQVCSDHGICCRTDNDVFLILANENKGITAEKLKVVLHRNVSVRFCDNPPALSFEEFKSFTQNAIEAAASAAENYTDEISKQLPHFKDLHELRKEIMRNPQNAPSIDSASRKLCISKGYFRAAYKKCFGVSYVQDCISERIMLARYLLCTTVMSVYAIASKCGYSDEKYFARQFHRNTGCSPVQYRKTYCGSQE